VKARMHSDELSTYSDELALGDTAGALATQLNALASAHTSALSEALDMLDDEAGTGLVDSSLDGITHSVQVKERDAVAALDLLEVGAAAAIDDVAELIAAGLPSDLPGGPPRLTAGYDMNMRTSLAEPADAVCSPCADTESLLNTVLSAEATGAVCSPHADTASSPMQAAAPSSTATGGVCPQTSTNSACKPAAGGASTTLCEEPRPVIEEMARLPSCSAEEQPQPLLLVIRTLADLDSVIHKGPEATISARQVMVGESGAGGLSPHGFVLATQSRRAIRRRVAEWLREAVIDLRREQTLFWEPEINDAIDKQALVLEACLAVSSPFLVVVADPSSQSWIKTPAELLVSPPPPIGEMSAFARRLATASNVVVMLGAGASVSAGIPDFRTPGTGLYDNLQKYNLPRPEAVFDISFFRENPAPFYQLCCELWPGTYPPTLAHHFIKLLHEQGQLQRCYSQNIDSLETAAGLPQEKVVAAHGNFDSAHVIDGGPSVPVEELRQAVMAGESALADLNERHGGLIKPAITFFGEALPRRFFDLVPDDFEHCDLLIVMGTSLKVQPFASLVEFVHDGTPRLLINREMVGESSFDFFGDGSADVFFQGDCDAGVSELARLAGSADRLDALVASSMPNANIG